jgi:hypothetical protein
MGAMGANAPAASNAYFGQHPGNQRRIWPRRHEDTKKKLVGRKLDLSSSRLRVFVAIDAAD